MSIRAKTYLEIIQDEIKEIENLLITLKNLIKIQTLAIKQTDAIIEKNQKSKYRNALLNNSIAIQKQNALKQTIATSLQIAIESCQKEITNLKSKKEIVDTQNQLSKLEKKFELLKNS